MTNGINLAPAMDEGNPPTTWTALRRELSPTPGRFENTLRMVVLVLITVTISETFRIPEAALSAYIVLFISRQERSSTVLGAIIASTAALIAIAIAILVFMISLSEPALRVPLIALVTFTAMFLARCAPVLGPALFAGGFIVAYGLTLGDQVIGLALQPGSVADTAEFALPEIAFLPPDEVLVHFLLWLSLVVLIPVTLVITANLLTGRDPAFLLRAALAERLEAAGQICAGEPKAVRRLMELTREGTGGLFQLHQLSRPPRRRETDAVLVAEITRLSLLLLATTRLPGRSLPSQWLASAGPVCEAAARAIRAGATLDRKVELPTETTSTPSARPIAAELSRHLVAIQGALVVAPGAGPPHEKAKRARAKLLSPEALKNPGNVRFAFKITLAVMIAYMIMSLTDWPGIHTCVVTCFFVSLGTIGETVHKAALRIGGCLIGGGLGIGTILLLMPVMNSIGDLLAVVAAVTFLAAWIGSGSERIAYAGWQIGMAFYLAILQGFGPTLDMETARDRILGIILGNVIVFCVFTTIWPVRVEQVVRAALARAVEQLAALMAPSETPDPAAETAKRQAFGVAIGQARAVMVNDRYEMRAAAQRPIDSTAVLDVQALFIPVSIILDLRAGLAASGVPQTSWQGLPVHDQAMAAWFHECAGWLRDGTGAESLAGALPALAEPDVPAPLEPANDAVAAWTFWSRLLQQDIRAFLRDLVPADAETGLHQAANAKS